MSSSDSIEVTASTVDLAISQALAQLGAEQDDVAIEVLSTPRAGLLGLGARQARVRVTRRAPEGARSGVMSPPPAPPLKPTAPNSPAHHNVRPTPRPQGPSADISRSPAPPRGERRGQPTNERAGEDRSPDRRREPPRAGDSQNGAPERPREPRRQDSRTQDARNHVPRGPRGRSQESRGQGGRGQGNRGQDARGQDRGQPDPRRNPPQEDRGGNRRPDERDIERDREFVGLSDAVGPEAEAGDEARKVANPEEQMREASTLLARILELMGEPAEIQPVDSGDPETLELNIKGDGSGILIGRHGQTLDALEYIVNRILAHSIKDAVPISIDTESYRARRRGQLQRMALAKGEQAKREHVAVMLDPMPPRDRRIVHLALKDDPMITTRSSGDGFLRAMEIMPVDERRGGDERGGEPRTQSRTRAGARRRAGTTRPAGRFQARSEEDRVARSPDTVSPANRRLTSHE
jgi:spoIIIJ-associated protein